MHISCEEGFEMTRAQSMEISVTYPVAGDRPRGAVVECASFGIVKGGGCREGAT